MNQTPEKIGKYDVIDILGKGSMGIVYKGHDAYVDRLVAITRHLHRIVQDVCDVVSSIISSRHYRVAFYLSLVRRTLGSVTT
ncbi:MAG: hypothetical protein AAF384_20080 [Pseudomonadota bacterium]